MASGNVVIWEDRFVRHSWPDCDKLFDYLPGIYHHTLNQTSYWVGYESTETRCRLYSCPPRSGCNNWDDVYPTPDQELSKRLHDFIAWLEWATDVEGNARWEVWS